MEDKDKSKNWIKLNRRLMKKSYYKNDHDKVFLWIHLLLKANFEPTEEQLGNQPIMCQPGQFTTGRRQLAEETGMHESKIERLLTFFEKIEQQIEQRKTNTNRLITILNWKSYQYIEQPNEQRANNERTTSEQRMNTLEEYKEEKESKKEKDFSDFEKRKKIEDERLERELEQFRADLLSGER